MFDLGLKDKVILITGGSDGLGYASAELLSSQGANVVICGRRGDYLKEKADIITEKTKNQVLAIQADVSKADDCKKLVEETISNFKKINVLVNNAGITKDGLLMRMKTDDWQKVLDLNLSGVFYCTRAVSRQMLKQKKGRIINITSVVGLMGNPGQANYSAAKAGVVGLTQSAAKEFASRGITVNAVAPGFISTDMTKDLNSESILSAIPLGRFGNPEDVAGAVRFLAADPSASYITGQVIQVDGGMVMS